MLTTPKRKKRAGDDDLTSRDIDNGLAGFEETPFSIKKRLAGGPTVEENNVPQPQFSVPAATSKAATAPANAMPPLSPSKRILQSVVKSPSKLRMMSKSFTPDSGTKVAKPEATFSPTPSPIKKIPRTPSKPRHMRSKEDLDQSARKRAYNVIMSNQMYEGEGGDGEVDETELRLAERIIQESYNDDDGMDSDYAPEPTTPGGGTNGRRRRTTKKSTKKEQDENGNEINNSDEDNQFSDTPETPSRRQRRRASPKSGLKAKNKTVQRRPTSTSAVESSPAGLEDSDEEFKKADEMAALFLDGYEGYFDQHKTRDKISTAPFSRARAVEFKEFIDYVDLSRGFHRDSRDFLLSLYRTMFTQWSFELSQGYSLLFYGVGSKRNLLLEFVTNTIPDDIPVLVVNGYNPATNFKELLQSLIPILINDSALKLPKNAQDLLHVTLRHLESTRAARTAATAAAAAAVYRPKVVLLVHNIDGESLRSDKSQTYLSQLASAPEVWVVATIDHINAPVMWDAAKLAMYNFLWHDLTTYESYAIETSFEDPLALGKVRTAAGNKGVKYVLSSLTMKARGLYRVLICHQIETMTNELHGSVDDQRNVAGTVQFGIEFKLLYQKCVEEFLVSNELNFRTMLTEFIDHKMVIITKDAAGTEVVYVPYTKETMETVLEEDLMD